MTFGDRDINWDRTERRFRVVGSGYTSEYDLCLGNIGITWSETTFPMKLNLMDEGIGSLHMTHQF